MPRTFASPPRGATGATGAAGGALALSLSSADAGLTGTVGQLDVRDISSFTADRTYTLPGTAAVGDRCGVMLSAGHATKTLLITATSGDTLNGISGGTTWSRLFIANEVLVFVCTVANTTWIVEQDGRIPMVGRMHLTTATDLTQSGSTWFLPTNEGGAWTTIKDVGSTCDATTGKFTFRRACTALIGAAAMPTGTADQNTFYATLSLNGTTPTHSAFGLIRTSGTAAPLAQAQSVIPFAAGDTLQLMAWHQQADKGLQAHSGSAGAMWFAEVL